jgi:hypothetical protein
MKVWLAQSSDLTLTVRGPYVIARSSQISTLYACEYSQNASAARIAADWSVFALGPLLITFRQS